MIGLVQGLGIMEEMGMVNCVDTRESKINAAIRTYRANPNGNIVQILADQGLDESDLTDREVTRIKRYVNYF